VESKGAGGDAGQAVVVVVVVVDNIGEKSMWPAEAPRLTRVERAGAVLLQKGRLRVESHGSCGRDARREMRGMKGREWRNAEVQWEDGKGRGIGWGIFGSGRREREKERSERASQKYRQAFWRCA
jgi:hypothetical protein